MIELRVVLLSQKLKLLVVVFLHVVDLSVDGLKELQAVQLHRQHALINRVRSGVQRLSCILNALAKLIVGLYLDLGVFVLRVITRKIRETLPELIRTCWFRFNRLQPS